MARGDNEINLSITADDQASKVIDDVADELDRLEDGAEVTVEADTSEALSAVEKFDRAVEGISDEAREVRFEFRDQQLQRKIRNLLRDLDRLDDPVEIEARTADLEDAQGELRELRDLAADKYDIDIDASAAKGEIADLGGTFDDLAGQIDGALDGLTGGLAQFAGPAGAAAGIATVLGGALTKTVELGTEIQEVATVLGTSTEEASKLRAVFADTGIEANDLQDIALQIVGALDGAPELAEELGLSIVNARKPAEALKAAIDGWDFLSSTQRAQLFGEEGVRQIGRLVSRGEDLDDLLAGIDGARVLDDDDVENARQLAETMAEFKATVEGLALEIGGPLAEAIAGLDDLLAQAPGIDGLADGVGKQLGLLFNPGGAIAGLFTSGGEEASTAFAEAFAADTADRVNDVIASTADAITDEIGEAAEETEIRYGRLQKAAGDDLAAAARRGIDAGRRLSEVGDAADDARDAIDDARESTDDWTGALGRLDAEAAKIRLDEKLAAARDEAELTRLDIIELTQEVVDYATEVLGIPTEVASQIVAEVDPQSLKDVEAVLLRLQQPRTIDYTVRVRDEQGRPVTGSGGSTGLAPVPVSIGPGIGQPVASALTVNVRTDAQMRQVDRAIQRWHRLNGSG